MKVRFQKLVSLLLVLVLCVGLCAVPASAAESRSVVDDVLSFYDAYFTTFSPFWHVIREFLPDGKTEETATDEDWKNAYKQYTINVQNNYGTTQFGSSGFYVPLDVNIVGLMVNQSQFVGFGSSVLPPFSVSSIIPNKSFFVAVEGIKDYRNMKFFRFRLPVSLPDSMKFRGNCSISVSSPFSATLGSSYLSFVENPFPVSIGIYNFSDNYVGLTSTPNFFMSGWSGISPDSYVDIIVLSTDYSFGSSFVLSPPVLYIQPEGYGVNDFTQNIGGTDSRVGSIVGDFGIVGDNGTIIKSDKQYIVNETDNSVYNPVTGDTSTITNWNYDYSDRSYNLTLESGDTMTVTYGDENITIKQGDTVYNVYYITNNNGGGDIDPTPPPDTHTHDYKSAVTTAPSCLSAGVKTFTCSICGDTYTERIPATGHTWVVDRTVNTTYDEEGNIVSQGYTIYKCSVCGNEYKDETDTGPPDGGGSSGDGGILDKLGELLGSIFGGILSVLGGIITSILDALTGIVNGIAERLQVVVGALSKVFAEVPAMFSGFTEFLGAAFGFLPPEIITILIFGILALVLVAVLKLFLK